MAAAAVLRIASPSLAVVMEHIVMCDFGYIGYIWVGQQALGR